MKSMARDRTVVLLVPNLDTFKLTIFRVIVRYFNSIMISLSAMCLGDRHWFLKACTERGRSFLMSENEDLSV